MSNKKLSILGGMVVVTCALSGLAGCSSMSTKSIWTEEKASAPDVDGTTAEYDEAGQNRETDRDIDEAGQSRETDRDIDEAGQAQETDRDIDEAGQAQETDRDIDTAGQNRETDRDIDAAGQNRETDRDIDAVGQNRETDRDIDAAGQNSERESGDFAEDHVSLDEVEIVNAAEFGNPKEVLDHMPMTSNVEVKKTEEDELQIEFELENVGLCTFTAGKEDKFVLPDEVFVDSTKVEWTASTADGEYIFPYMRVNETGDMFMIDWTYNGYGFAVYGKSPKDTSDRDMAGKIALAIIYHLGGVE